jgi:hypothetical protein
MWVQDRLPNIFRASAGAAQKRADYALGYGRQECIVSHGYPRERFIPAMVGFNENRFAARELSRDELDRYACDVSFVSHASTPPEVLVQREIDKTPLPEGKRFLADVLERFRAIYDGGGYVSEGGQIRKIIRESMTTGGIETSDLSGLLDFFIQKVNNAFFRQQALAWLSEMDVNLHLWGRGWDEHPRFKRFARGIADNEKQLGAIYQASSINLQVTPFGAVHQRLFDGLSAGGFFLLRHCTGDDCDPIYRKMWEWCEEAGIGSGPQFFAQAPEHVREMIAKITDLTAEDPSTIPDTFFLGLEEAAAAGFTRSAATLFAEYKGISFRNRAELQSRVSYFLLNPEHRRQIAQSMRARVIDSMTYKAITSRLLRFISADLSAQLAARAAA